MSILTPAIALITDFGQADHYVAAMKAVIYTLSPNTPVIDITHEIEPYNVAQAMFNLEAVYRLFPPETIFVVVVDPGVGTSRKGLLIESPAGTFIGPDNGVFSLILGNESCHCFEIKPDWPAAPTFHGRDIFARVAAMKVTNKKIPTVPTEPTILDLMAQKKDANTLEAKVIHIDRFGNAILNFRKLDWEKRYKSRPFGVRYEGVTFDRWADTFGHLEPGEIGLIWGSSGFLQLSANQQNAANLLLLRQEISMQIRFKLSLLKTYEAH